MIELLNKDCMELLKETPDKFYDLAIVDPPYGIGIDGQKKSVCKNPKHNRKEHLKKSWDNSIPNRRYFDELYRVSKYHIIWGANYFTHLLPERTKGWVFWYKGQQDLTMSDGELAYSNFDKPTRMVNINRGFISINGGSIHPTQKPVKLYEWLLLNYAKPNDKILDTHGGSMSIALAVHNVNQKEQMNLSLTLTELDEDYYKAGVKRYENHIKQKTIFDL